MEALSCEFDVLSERLCVLYTFWTAWFTKDKVKLLDLVAAEPNILAIAVYLTSQDKPYEGQPFNTKFILQQLSAHNPESKWTLYKSIPGCRFICGNETATAVVFRRMQSMVSSDQQCQVLLQANGQPVHFEGFQVLGLGPNTQDGWLDMCNVCAGGGGG
jgi:hypothetical protein